PLFYSWRSRFPHSWGVGLTMAERSAIALLMNKLSTDRRAALVASLVEGNSARATARMTDTAYNTVLKFVVDIGKACTAFYDQSMQNLDCRRLQCDEIWQVLLCAGSE